MKKLSLAMVIAILLSITLSFSNNVIAAETDFAWVLVERYEFPIPQVQESHYTHKLSMSDNTIEVQLTTPYGLGAYASADYNNPANMHARYTWSEPPHVIKANETISINFEQEVISNKNGNYALSFAPFFHLDSADLSLGTATGGKVYPKIVYPNGVEGSNFGLGYWRDEESQKSITANMSLKFSYTGSPGSKKALYMGVYTGYQVGVKYIYEWMDASKAPINNAESFGYGVRIMWQPANGIGYRLYRSNIKGNLGISVTDFYIDGTSFADVNVEPNTTYYYTVKPVLAEAKPFEGIEEKLGSTIATFTVTTKAEAYQPGKFKHFMLLKLDDPKMSVDGTIQEIDPGRGTVPTIIANRTMVPIRAIVEAMNGKVEWDGSTQKITLKARGSTVEMWIGKTEIKINGTTSQMDVAPTIKNERTYVPVRFAAENLNCKVDWINSTKEAVIVYEE
ncbi:MAG: copper amine oxidase N-terminal domain-containing protein [Tissierellaceae bacterium]|nr:copper amine oxidase N-terminal domain-containing protein [Tissierellaceae bacterium]